VRRRLEALGHFCLCHLARPRFALSPSRTVPQSVQYRKFASGCSGAPLHGISPRQCGLVPFWRPSTPHRLISALSTTWRVIPRAALICGHFSLWLGDGELPSSFAHFYGERAVAVFCVLSHLFCASSRNIAPSARNGEMRCRSSRPATQATKHRSPRRGGLRKRE
jgi:hypothetical protein